MCLRQAFVVRKAPSRWMARSFFQSAKGKSTSGLTIWMPAFDTRMSILPYFATTSATPSFTWSSSVTFMATAKASPPCAALISSAAAFAAARLRSAITGVAPSAAKRRAISLPMPLAAPVTIAILPSKRAMSSVLSSGCGPRSPRARGRAAVAMAGSTLPRIAAGGQCPSHLRDDVPRLSYEALGLCE